MNGRSQSSRRQGDPLQRFGVSLIEVMVSMVLISTLMLVSLTATGNLLRTDVQQRDENQGQQLAAQFLDEVSSMDFRDRIDPIHGLESDENAKDRQTFDDVDDYNRYTATPPTHRDGTTINNYDGWSIAVSVIAADPDATGITTISSDLDSPLRIITVVCTSPAGTSVQASTMVSNVPNNNPDTNSYEKWRRVQLTFPDRVIDVTAPLRNNPDTSI